MRILLAFFLIWAVAGQATAEREETACEICGGTVYQTPKSYVSGNTKYVYIDKPPYKPYCTRCQRDVNNGKIDPANPPILAARDDEENEPSDNPYAVDKFEWEKEAEKPKVKDRHTQEAEAGFGVLPWAIGITVGLGLLIRFLLKG